MMSNVTDKKKKRQRIQCVH